MKNRIFGGLVVVFAAVALLTSMMLKEEGIEFKKFSFEKAKAEAAKEGKLIFIDCYTDWCGPCKQMANSTFKDPEVGEVFNKSFVNIKVEMEKDADGAELARTYRVQAYPTLLIVDQEGKLIKQIIGFKRKEQLLSIIDSVL